jgi:hypothetical protein
MVERRELILKVIFVALLGFRGVGLAKDIAQTSK